MRGRAEARLRQLCEARNVGSLALFLCVLGATGCGSACPTISCTANLRFSGNVPLAAQTSSLDVKFCFNANCQSVTLDLESQRCAALRLSADSAVCATAPKGGATRVSISVSLSNGTVHDGDRYLVSIADAATSKLLGFSTGTISYIEQTSSQSACDLPTCKSATVSF